MPRKEVLTDAERKKRKQILNRTYYHSKRAARAPNVINIGEEEGERWFMLQTQMNFVSNQEVAKFLLDSHFLRNEASSYGSTGNQAFGSGRTSASTSTPLGSLRVPYLLDMPSIKSSLSTDSAQMKSDGFLSEDVEMRSSMAAHSANQRYDPHDITQDNIDVDVMVTDKEDEEYLEDDLKNANFSPSKLNINYGDKTIDYASLPIVGEDDEEEEEWEGNVEEVNETIKAEQVNVMLDNNLVICFVSKIMELANMNPPKKCDRCQGDVEAKYKLQGTGIRITWVCVKKHEVASWNSQPYINCLQAADLLLSSNILLSGNDFGKIQKLFRFMNLGFVNRSTFLAVQANYCVPVVSKFWEDKQRLNMKQIRGKNLILLGDGQTDSSGQYLNYNIMDKGSGNILACNVFYKIDTGVNAPDMEIVGFKEGLQFLEDDGQTIEEVVTDNRRSIKSYMAKEKKNIKHSTDIWHSTKSVTEQLNKATQDTENKDLVTLSKKIVNHFWFCARNCGTDANMFRSIWLRLLQHIVEHEWRLGNGLVEPNRLLEDLEEEPKELLQKQLTAFSTLRNIVSDRNLLKNVPYFINFRHTGTLESFHCFKLMYASERYAYSPSVYKTRCILAALDFNAHKYRKDLTDGKGQPRLVRKFSKRSNNWSAHRLKEKRQYLYIKNLLRLIVEARMNDNQHHLQSTQQIDMDDHSYMILPLPEQNWKVPKLDIKVEKE